VTLRPIDLKGKRHIQFVYYDERKCIAKNHAGDDVVAPLDELLRLPFKNLQVGSTAGDINININKSGKALIHRTRASLPISSGEVPHDRQKDLLLPEGKPDLYLQAIGFMTADGRIKADKQKKFRQINEFLKLIDQSGALEQIDTPVIEAVDCGCGNAYLTFAVYHYLNHIRGRPMRVVGVDVKGELLDKHARTVAELGWDGLTFINSTIAGYTPSTPPDITLALHACDTATDEALAQGIRWGSKLIVSVPCCHHDLQEQMRHQAYPDMFRPVFRHGILAERQIDLLTDSFRALILRIMGYQTEVLQFISQEHTAKNLMIRAIRTDSPVPWGYVEEYRQMRACWNVTPCLESLLGADFLRRIDSAP
jgi:SAM-dependent methyltransferase